MANRMDRFLTSIGVSRSLGLDLEFEFVSKNLFDPSQIDMAIHKQTPWNYESLARFIEGLGHINYKYSIRFSYETEVKIESAREILLDWGNDHRYGFSDVIANGAEELCLFYRSSDDAHSGDELKEAQDFFAFLNYPYRLSVMVETSEEEKKKEEEERLNRLKEAEATFINQKKEAYLREKMWSKGNYQEVENIDKLYSMGVCNVAVTGMAFGNIEARNSKAGKMFARFQIGDDTGAISVRLFETRGVEPEDIEGLVAKSNKGKALFPIKVYGALQEDRFDHVPAITVHKFEYPEGIKLREDPYPRKRTELHLHTNMSAMDGVASIASYASVAKNMGMSAIGVTDHGVVQSFPAAQTAGKKYGLKIVYGCELYMIEDRQTIILNPAHRPLKGARFCVFDTETTGLSSRYDRIIEFGGVIVEDGKIVDQFNQYYDPGMPIPEEATRINHITDDMVRGKPKIEDDLERILSFFGDCILVAHNATFDIGMVNAALSRKGLPPLTNPVIDTMPISHYLFPEAARHSEGAMLRNLGLGNIYSEEDAHEAVYDATALNEGWKEILERLEKQHPNLVHSDLSSLSLPLPDPADPDHGHYEATKRKYNSFCSHLHPYHATVWVKNKEGLSALYRLVTEAHTSYFSRVPKTPKRLLEQYRENLIVGSACFNGEIFELAQTKSAEELKKAMGFYDVIEIQPIENYSYLINMGIVRDQAHLLEILNDIIMAARELGKPIIATGDCHYVNPSDKIVRDVYIGTKTPSLGLHPLSPSSRADKPAFENPDQHLRSTQEMIDSFSAWIEDKDFVEQIVIDNPNKIAEEVEVLEPVVDDLFKPDANLPHSDRILRDMCEKNFEDRYCGNPDPEVKSRIEEVHQRLEKELNGIIGNGYSVTYIIASKLIKMAHDEPEHYIVGSRGSVGSSFVATMADITEVNPLPPHYLCPHCHYFEWGDAKTYLSGFDLPDKQCPHCGATMKGNGQNIPFETFLGFHADKVPDIDLNFEDESQHKAHNYTKILLGEHNVYRCGTIETVAEKTAFGYVKGYFEDQGRDCNDPIFKNYIAYLAARCQGVKRTTGQHPGGIIVVPSDHSLFEFTAVQYPANDLNSEWMTTHYDFHSMHDELLKLDILGHVDPMAMRYYRDFTGVPIESIPMNDKRVLSLFTSPKELHLSDNFLGVKTGASGLPEFGTDLAQRMLVTANPQCFNDLLIISGLAHGTNVWSGNAEDLITSGQTDLHGVIGCRDDIMTYLIKMGLDPSMSFKIMEGVRKGKGLSSEQEAAMVEHKVPDYYIESCKKIKYLFPRGHATAYVMMAVRVAYFKLYYPLEFYAVFFSVRCDAYEIKTMIDGIDAVKKRIQQLQSRFGSRDNPLSPKESDILDTLKMALEMEQRGFHFGNIDLYKSDAKLFLTDKEHGCLIPPFSVLDNLGESAARSVVEARNDGRRFLSKENLKKRTKLSATNIADLDALGVLKGLGETDQASIFDFLS